MRPTAWAEDPTVTIVEVPAVPHDGGEEALAGRLDPGTEIVVFAPPTTSSDQIRPLVARLRRDAHLDAVGHLVPVVDAVKRIDVSDRVTATLHRPSLGHLALPLAVRRDRASGGSDSPGIHRIGVM